MELRIVAVLSITDLDFFGRVGCELRGLMRLGVGVLHYASGPLGSWLLHRACVRFKDAVLSIRVATEFIDCCHN